MKGFDFLTWMAIILMVVAIGWIISKIIQGLMV